MAMGDFGGLTTGAVEASMSATCATILGESLAKMFSRTMQADRQVILCQPELRSNFRGLLSFEINLLEKLAVLLRNHGQQAFETLAENPFILLARRLGKLFLKTSQGPGPSTLPTVNVNDGAPENAVKPGGGLLLMFGLPFRRQSFHQTFLHDVIGHVGRILSRRLP